MLFGRGRGIRTPDILLPKQARYQTALYPAICASIVALASIVCLFRHSAAAEQERVPQHPFPGKMARPERFELPTTKFVAWYSIQLSYGRTELLIMRVGGWGVNCDALQARVTTAAAAHSQILRVG